MLKNEFARHTIAFLTITLASIFLYPAAQAGQAPIPWLLLGMVTIAATFTLMKK